MTKRGIFAVLLSALGALIVTSAAAADAPTFSPQDFASGVRIDGTETGDAFFRLDLPAQVYGGVAWPDLRDIRVFDAQGQAVPFWLRRQAAHTLHSKEASLHLFNVPNAKANHSPQDASTVTVQTREGRYEVNVPQTSRDGDGALYLLEWRDSERPVLSRMRFDWEKPDGNWRGNILIMGSDDLQDWEQVTSGTLADLKAGADSLRINDIALNCSCNFQYWLVSFDAPAPTLKAVNAIHEEEVPKSEMPSLAMPGKALSSTEVEYDMGRAVAPSFLRVRLPSTNSIAQVEISARARPNDSWQVIATPILYRLREQTSADIPVSRTIQAVRIVAKGAGWGSGVPTVDAMFDPRVVVFNARGPGPFILAWGSRAADAEALSDATTIPGVTDATAIERLPEASLGGTVRLGGPARLTARSAAEARDSWQKTALWIVLVLGAAVMAWMAFSLLREAKRKPT